MQTLWVYDVYFDCGSLIQLTENDAKSLSKAPCLVALNMYLTLHLLLFGQLKQSM